MFLPNIQTDSHGVPIYTAEISRALFALADIQYQASRKVALKPIKQNFTTPTCDESFWTGRNQNNKIVDIVRFAFEIDLLEIRMHELNDVVDNFVIYEGSHTDQGIPKPFIFHRYRDRFKPFMHKIVYIQQNGTDAIFYTPKLFKNTNKWVNENNRKFAYDRYVEKYPPNENTLFISADIDEIPNPSAIWMFKHCKTTRIPCAFYCSMFEVDAEHIRITRDGKGYWTQPTIIRRNGPLRHSRQNMYPLTFSTGAHLHVRDPYAFIGKMLGTAEAGPLDGNISDPIMYFKKHRRCKHLTEKKGIVAVKETKRRVWVPLTTKIYRSYFPYMWPSFYKEWDQLCD